VGKVEAVADVIHKVILVHGEQYSIRLEPDLEDGGFVVHCETPPGCTSHAETIAEALDMIADAIHLVVTTYREKGWPLVA
jgi:predicted RNase H-like HicB family nuclease